MKQPLVSIIIVNYNGKKFIHECLSSIYGTDFPKSKFEIILVDNNSQDLSIKFTQENFPDVRIIKSDVNFGFAKGCNLGISFALGKYIVLLNNDTRVEKGWLTYLVKLLESDSNIAAVNSKLLLFYPFFELSLNSDIHLRSEFTSSINFQSVGVLIENIVLENKHLQGLIRYKSGFYEKDEGIISTRWTKGQTSILIPCDPNISEVNLIMTIRAEKSSSNLKTSLSVKLGSEELVSDIFSSHQVKQYNLSIKTDKIKDQLVYGVQNSGVVVFKSGYGRDRGAVVKGDEQFYELDNSFYNKSVQIHAFSGASVIIRKDVFEDLGGFDESFFMYYEDVDLSLRMKRMGWNIVYEPKSVVYHIHSGSSGEWSSFFIFNVEKNHLATVIKHLPFTVVIKELIYYLGMLLSSLRYMVIFRLRENWDFYDIWRDRVDIRIKVWGWVFQNFLQLFTKRVTFTRKGKRSIFQVYNELY